jgi:AcrR family transcriptional regulator
MVYQKSAVTENRKFEKQKLIFDTAAKVFSEKGYNAASIKDITTEAGISVGTFYLYFKNKEDLIEQLYDEMARILASAEDYAINKQECSVAEKFSKAIASCLWAYQKYRKLARILMIEAVGLNPRFEQKRAEISRRLCEQMEELFKMLMEKELISIPDARVAALAYEGSFNVVNYALQQNDEQTDLTKHAYALAIYNLQALKIDFEYDKVTQNIQEIL